MSHDATRLGLITDIRCRTFYWWKGSGAFDGILAFLSLAGSRTFDDQFFPADWDQSWFEEAMEWIDLADILLDS